MSIGDYPEIGRFFGGFLKSQPYVGRFHMNDRNSDII
jgi:hypothetical protein